MLKAIEPHPVDTDLDDLLEWFRRNGGVLKSAEVRFDNGKRSLVATRDIEPNALLMRVPHQLLLSTKVAMQSPIGLRLQAAGVTDDQTFFAAFLADAQGKPGYWRPLADLAASRDFGHLPQCFDRADWDLLQGSDVQRLARKHWNNMRAGFRRADDVLRHTQRLTLRAFAPAWQLALRLRYLIATGQPWARPALVPLAGLLEYAPNHNCRFEDSSEGAFEVRANRAIPAGTALTAASGRFSAADLLTRCGMAQEEDPIDVATLLLDIGSGHWLHAFAPGLTGGAPSVAFRLMLDTNTTDARKLFSLLRLAALGSRRNARAHPAAAGADRCDVPMIDPSNERAAMQRLLAACERAIAAFTCTADEDDRLLAGSSLTPRQRNAVLVRRGEKRVLLHYQALARDALALLDLSAPARRDTVAERATQAGGNGYFSQLRDGLPVEGDGSFFESSTDITPHERRLFNWFREEGGHLGPVALRRENGLRGMFATRDIAKGELLIRVPRHLYLTLETSRQLPVGLRLRDVEGMGENEYIGVCLAAARGLPGHWQPVIDTMPASFPGRPALFSPEDWELLRGSYAQVKAGQGWKRMMDTFRGVQAALPARQRMPQREYVWGVTAAQTRTYQLRIDGAITTGVVPVGDMMNHAADRNCTWGGDDTHHFDIRATRDVRSGTELTITYGAKPNTTLFSQYGFRAEGNPNELAVVGYELEASHWLRVFAPELTEGDGQPEFYVDRDPLSSKSARLFSFLRLYCLPDARSAQAFASVPKASIPMIDAANEEAVLRKLIGCCEKALGAFTCGPEEDDRLLDGDTLTPIQRTIVCVRRDEKRVLQQACAEARDALAMLQGTPVDLEKAGPWKEYFRTLAAKLPARDASIAR